MTVLAAWIRVSRHPNGLYVGGSLYCYYCEEGYVATELRTVPKLI